MGMGRGLARRVRHPRFTVVHVHAGVAGLAAALVLGPRKGYPVTPIVSFVVLKVLDATMGLRVDGEQEEMGLDLALHDERGYILRAGLHPAEAVSSRPIPGSGDRRRSPTFTTGVSASALSARMRLKSPSRRCRHPSRMRNETIPHRAVRHCPGPAGGVTFRAHVRRRGHTRGNHPPMRPAR